MELSRRLYMNPGMDPTIDRPKPLHVQSKLYLRDDTKCLPYAQTMCEYLRGTDAYLQCVDDHFHACRRGTGTGCDCGYTGS